MKIAFPDPTELSPPIINVKDISFKYAEGLPTLFTKVDFGLDMQSRVSMVGPNGVGKSTLLSLILGKWLVVGGGSGGGFTVVVLEVVVLVVVLVVVSVVVSVVDPLLGSSGSSGGFNSSSGGSNGGCNGGFNVVPVFGSSVWFQWCDCCRCC